MSRIFDALRKYEQERAGKKPAESGAGESQWPELLTSLDRPKADLDKVERVTCQPGPEQHILLQAGSHDVAAERFRVLRQKLQQLQQQRSIKKLLITSPAPREGKSSTSINLAATFSLASGRVLLICGDLRSPGVPRILGLPVTVGLAEALEGQLEWQSSLRHVNPLGIYYLAAGETKRNPVELLQGDKMRKLAAEAGELFDWVIIDAPPVNMFADAHCLAMVSDAVLLVARAGWTTPESFQEGLKALSDTFLAGVVFNCAEDATRRGYYSKYYRTHAAQKH